MRDLKSGILFVHNGATRFVRLDLELLKERHCVTEWCILSRRMNPLVVCHRVMTHDLVFGWFASWHTFLPMLFARFLGKPSVLVIGGYDLASMPQIGYGHQRGGLKKWVSRWTMRLARCLITNSAYSRDEAERNTGIPRERVHVVYHGVPDPFESLPTVSRAPMALTVGNVDRANLWRKGHEPFVRAAAFLPDVEFVLVGEWKDDAIGYLRGLATPNVTFRGRVDGQELLHYYQRASVYVQPSLHEGFGLSVAEAMLGGCIPLVTKAAALPEVVGDCGVYINTNEPSLIANGIRKALSLPQEVRMRARLRILRHFSMAERGRNFEALLSNTLQD